MGVRSVRPTPPRSRRTRSCRLARTRLSKNAPIWRRCDIVISMGYPPIAHFDECGEMHRHIDIHAGFRDNAAVADISRYKTGFGMNRGEMSPREIVEYGHPVADVDQARGRDTADIARASRDKYMHGAHMPPRIMYIDVSRARARNRRGPPGSRSYRPDSKPAMSLACRASQGGKDSM